MIIAMALNHILAASGGAVCSIDGATCSTDLPNVGASGGDLQSVLQIVFGIAGGLSVLMIVVAGLRFVTAQGNPQEVSKAKNTIVYSLVGLLVALAAEAIVSFTLGSL